MTKSEIQYTYAMAEKWEENLCRCYSFEHWVKLQFTRLAIVCTKL